MDERSGGAGSGRGLLRPLVLAPAGVARLPRRNGGGGALGWLAAIPSVLGFAVALRCVWDFGWTGHGTPAPIAPPKRLVVVGFYRYLRNPMYVGFVGGWIGLWVVFGHFNLPLAIAIAGPALVVHP